MYWTGDKYQPVNCEENLKGISIVSIDRYKLAHFRRIKQPDTLTKNALGKVWYAKKDGKVEFYTDSGTYPTDADKRLLPVTKYILGKYISYHRYVLNFILWSGGIILFSLLFGIGSIYIGRKVRRPKTKVGMGKYPLMHRVSKIVPN